MSAFLGADRYKLIQSLGSGTFGEVFEVFDHERGIKVALKRPHETSAEGLYYFKREFRTLADMLHPNLVELHELVGENGNWFFTMELVKGTRFTRFLRQHAPQAICQALNGTPSPTPAHELLRSLLRQLAEGLSTLHRAGKLHRDIKPSNVLVTEEGRLVILDFGLSVEFSQESPSDTLATRMIGTPTYMSPEQLSGFRGTEASDWYSVGVMLYEVLTGRLPFSGGILEITRAKLDQDPRPPSELVGTIPRDLEDICLGLLRRDPAVRLNGEDLLRQVCKEDRVSIEPEDLTLHSIPFVGRESELLTLFDTFHLMIKGQSTLLHLHGNSGIGKTHLLRHFMKECQRWEPNTLILQGRCYEQESVPYKALDPLIDELSRYLSRLPVDKVESLAPRNAFALTRLFPVLSRIDSLQLSTSRTSEPEDDKVLRQRASLGLRDLLGRLSEIQPVVIVIDDLQWGDSDSIRLIRELLSPPDPPAMMVVACYRTEERTSSPALKELLSAPTGARSLEVPLAELSSVDAERLALTLMGPQVSNALPLAKRIAKDSNGNPFFVGELAQHVRFGALRSAHPAEEFNLFSCILQRLSALPPETQHIVEVLAIAGHPLPWEVVTATSEVEGARVPPSSLQKAGRLLKTRRSGDCQTLEIYHDFVRKAVLSSMAAPKQRQLHILLAQAMEAGGWIEPETLAQHYLLADDKENAAEWTKRAAEQAEASLAFKSAADLYRRALLLRSPGDPLIPSLLERLAESLASAGRGKESAEIYIKLTSTINHRNKQERLRYHRRAAEEYFRCGFFEQGLSTIKPLLVHIGMTLPTTQLSGKLSERFYSLILRLRGHGFVERCEKDIPPSELEPLDICWTVVQGLGVGALMRGMDFQVRHLLLALKVGEPSRIIRAFARQAYLEAMHDGDQRSSRTQFYSSVSISLAEKHGDPKLIGHAYMSSGMAAWLQGRWASAVEDLTRAQTIFAEKCIGVAAELNSVQTTLLHSQVLQGKVIRDLRLFYNLLEDTRERGDILSEANLLTSFAIAYPLLMRNNFEEARSNLTMASEICAAEGFQFQTWQLFYVSGFIEHYAGNTAGPWHDLERYRKELVNARLMDIEYIRLSWCEHIARSAIAYARSCPRGSQDRLIALSTAHPAIRALRNLKASHWRATYAKLRAIEAEAHENRNEALNWLLIAEGLYNNHHMTIHARSTQWCRGFLMGEAGSDLLHNADDWLRSIGVVDPKRYANTHLPCIDL